MPSTTPGARGSNPFEQARHAARELARVTGSDNHDVLVVLGTGLSPVARLLGADGPPIDLTTLPWFARFTGVGHRPEAWSIPIAGSQALVVAGRLHLYEGRTPAEVVHTVRTAIASGVRTVILTCSAGAVNTALPVGAAVLISDHINMTATSPLVGDPGEPSVGSRAIDMTDTWSPRLRALARQVAPSLPEGVYAQMLGPQFETPAEIRMLTSFGVDLVGMPTVPEAIAARHLGAEVLGLAVVGNPAAGLGEGPVDLDELTEATARASHDVAQIVRGVIERAGEPGTRPSV